VTSPCTTYPTSLISSLIQPLVTLQRVRDLCSQYQQQQQVPWRVLVDVYHAARCAQRLVSCPHPTPQLPHPNQQQFRHGGNM
jgi:hypothetical protein